MKRRVLLSLAAAALFSSAVVHAAPIDGIWTGDVGGRTLVLLLRERTGGRLVGALPGETGSTITSGQRSGKTVTFDLEGADPGGSFTGTFTGTLSGSTLAGTGTIAGESFSVTLAKSTTPRRVVHWLLATITGGSTRTARFPRVENAAGGFLAGSFVNQETCDFIACGGAVTTWTVAGGAHAIATRSGEACVTTASLTGTFDPTTRLLSGTWNRPAAPPCAPDPAGGDFFGGKEGSAPLADVESLLATLSDFGDAIESESVRNTMRAFSAAYLHDGTTRADWEARFTAIYATHHALQARVFSVGPVVTVNDADVHPEALLPPRAEWRLVVTGLPDAGGARETVLDRTSRFTGQEELYWLGAERGSFVFTGNGQDAPFSIAPPLASGDEARATYGVWPFGVHGGGHPEGHPGWDFEIAADRFVRAAAAGTVVSIREYGQKDVAIRHRPGYLTNYHHLRTLEPGIVVGAAVASGQALGLPGEFDAGALHMTHFDLRVARAATCPLAYLSTTGRALFDSLWSRAAYREELVEPYPCNPIDVAAPLARAWTRASGGAGLVPAADSIEFSRADLASIATTYVMRDAGGATLESGSVTLTNPLAEPAGTLELVPDGGAPRHYARYDVVDGTMRIVWSDAGFPADLTGAGVFTTPP